MSSGCFLQTRQSLGLCPALPGPVTCHWWSRCHHQNQQHLGSSESWHCSREPLAPSPLELSATTTQFSTLPVLAVWSRTTILDSRPKKFPPVFSWWSAEQFSSSTPLTVLFPEIFYWTIFRKCAWAALTLPVLDAFQLIQVLLGAENSQVESCAGAFSSESILQRELLSLYTGLEADSTCNSSASVYNNIHTITKRAQLRGERGGL